MLYQAVGDAEQNNKVTIALYRYHMYRCNRYHAITAIICGEKLKNCGYQFKWSFEEALADWFEDNDRKWLK